MKQLTPTLVFEDTGPALEDVIEQILCRNAALWQEEWQREAETE